MLRQIKSSAVSFKPSAFKDLFLSFLSAVLLILSFPGFNIEFLAWFAFVPLFFAIQNKSKIKAFFLSYFAGIIFWFGIIYWLVHVTLPGMIILVLYLAIYFGVFGLLFSFYTLYAIRYTLLVIPAFWVLLEYIRSHLFTGFPWALLGYSQYLNLSVIQIADITGVWGVSYLVMMVNVAIYSVIGYWLSVIGKGEKCLFAILVLIATLAYGYYKLYRVPSTLPDRQAGEYRVPLKISVIQGNIAQELKWNPISRDYIINKYLNLTQRIIKDKPDLIIWPEAALPVVLEEEPVFFDKVKAFVKETKVPLLLGAVTTRDGQYYNSAILISKKGEPLTQYDKLHLVPFGEYIPFKKTLRFLENLVPIGDFTFGKEYTVLQVRSSEYRVPSKLSVLICFEDLFPQISREFTKRGADFLVNITNDAWFKITSSPYQHLQASVFRAVENRITLIRAANTGVSGFIAPSGKIISLVQNRSGQNLFIDGYATQEIIIAKKKFSFYTKYGDTFILFCFIFGIFGVIRLVR